MHTNCTDVCEAVIDRLLRLGFTREELGVDDEEGEDHDKILTCLSWVKFVRTDV